jgi:hypothetical protein
MANRELREWLGITWADLLVYLATAAVAAMFFVSQPVVDVVLAVIGIALAIAACPLGMKRDPEVSGITNGIKLVAYPLYVLLAVAAVVVHYIWFNN